MAGISGSTFGGLYNRIVSQIKSGVIAVGRELDQNVIVQNLKDWIEDNLESLAIHSYRNIGDKPNITINGYTGKVVDGASFTVPSTPKDKGMQVVPDIDSIENPDPEIIYKQMVDTAIHPKGQYTWDGVWHRQPLDIKKCKKVNYIKDFMGYAEYDYDTLDDEKAFLYFQQKYTVHPVLSNPPSYGGGGCTVVRKNNIIGRNLDLTYDNEAEYVIRTNHTANKNMFIGLSSATGIDNEVLKTLGYSDLYDILPYHLVDGVNEHHLFCEINLVPSDKGITNQDNPSKSKRIYANMIVEYVLANHSTAQQACLDIVNNFNVIGVPGHEAHFMIADMTHTYILEFINNETRYVDLKNDITQDLYQKEWMTNFHITDGAKTKVEEHIESLDWSSIEPHGQGLERWQYILENISTVYDLDTMFTLMCNLNYSKAYQFTNPLQWKSEFTGESETYGDITIDSTDEEFTPLITKAREIFANRSRDKQSEYYGTWQTNHTSIYDIENLTLNVICQEESKLNTKVYSINDVFVFDDSDSAKYAMDKGSSNFHLQEQFSEIREEIKSLSGAVLKGNCTLTDISSETAISNQLTEYIREHWSCEPDNNYMLYTTYNGAIYIDYIYSKPDGEEGRWLPSTDRRNFDLTTSMLTNAYNVSHLDFSGEGAIQKLKVIGGDTYILMIEALLKTPIVNIGSKEKIGELPIQVGGSLNVPMMIRRGTERKQTSLIAQWYEVGGEHYIDIDTLYANAEFYFDDVTIDDEDENIGTQEVDAGNIPIFLPNGMPKMIKTQKKLTIADTESATSANPIYVRQVMRDNDGNPVPKMHGSVPVLDRNGNQAWVTRQMRVYVNKDYLYGKELHLQGCPINENGNLGYHDAADDPDFYCDYFNEGHYVGTHGLNGIYTFRPSYAFDELTLTTGLIEDDPSPATTASIYKLANDTCAGFSISYQI